MTTFIKQAVTLTIAGMMTLSTYEALAQEQKNFTPESMMQIYRIGSPALSPDAKHFIYSRSLPNLSENNSKSEIMIGNVNLTGSVRSLLPADVKGHSATFLSNDQIAYIETSGDHAQIAIIRPDGSGHRVLSSFDFDVQGFLFSPQRDRVIVIRTVELPKIVKIEHPDLDKTSGQIFDDLMYKHWDEWNETVPQSFIATVDADMAVGTSLTPILGEGELYELPTKPFGGVEQLSWSPDGQKIAYSCRKKQGLDYALSTNTDIYIYDLATKVTTNITEGMLGYDTHPTYASDGSYIAWLSMEHDGYEADVPRIFVMDLRTGTKRHLSERYEYYPSQIAWVKDNKALRFVSNDQGLNNVFEITIKDAKITQLTKFDMADVTEFAGTGDKFIFGLQSMQSPTDLYAFTPAKRSQKNANILKLTTENDDFLAQFPNIEIQKRWLTTTDGGKMLTWVVLPPNFDATKKYPAILYCQGGPQSTVSQFWSYRWNIRTFASHGYIMVCPNRHGVPGFGKAWNEQISGDYGGQNMRDYFTAIDEVAKEPYVDAERLGATGASYGGFSVYWLAGHHNGRFKALMAHAGIFNLEAQYLETEEKFFANWDMGGAYWDKENKVAQNTFANSPHRFVDKWTAPILISVGDYDFRILSSQGMQAFDAAKMRGIPARLLYYPDESHWIVKPQNGVLFYRTWFNWMDKYLKR